MQLPEPIDEHIQGAKSLVTRASWIDGELTTGNAIAFLKNGRVFIASEPGLVEPFEAAVARITELGSELADRGLKRDGTNAVENARAMALLAIDELAAAWTDAPLSDHAKALGYGPLWE
jgi:hypothetical protein